MLVRTFFLATVRTTLWFLTTFLATQRYDHFDKYVAEKGGPENLEDANRIVPYAKMVLYCIYSIRLFINIAAFKWPNILKAYYYMEMLGVMTESFIPNDLSLEYETMFVMMECI